MKTLKEDKDQILGQTEIKNKAKYFINLFLPWIEAADRDKTNAPEFNLHIAKECALLALSRVENAVLDYATENLYMENLNSELIDWEQVRVEIKNYQAQI